MHNFSRQYHQLDPYSKALLQNLRIPGQKTQNPIIKFTFLQRAAMWYYHILGQMDEWFTWRRGYSPAWQSSPHNPLSSENLRWRVGLLLVLKCCWNDGQLPGQLGVLFQGWSIGPPEQRKAWSTCPLKLEWSDGWQVLLLGQRSTNCSLEQGEGLSVQHVSFS